MASVLTTAERTANRLYAAAAHWLLVAERLEHGETAGEGAYLAQAYRRLAAQVMAEADRLEGQTPNRPTRPSRRRAARPVEAALPMAGD